MNLSTSSPLIRQADYAQKLRSLLPPEAFLPDRQKIVILGINLAILLLGFGMASYLDRYPWYLLWLYLPCTLIMGNSVVVLLFSSHDVMHSRIIPNRYALWLVSLLGLAALWMPPTLWKAVHNRVHHNHTNSYDDPDRNYLFQQPDTWGKWIQDLFVPSVTVHPVWFTLGMTMAWGVHTLRNLTSVVLFNTGNVDYVPAAFQVKPKERWAIALETLILIALHFGVMAYLEFHPIKLLLGYFLPIGLGYAGVIFYIYTNHMLSPMTEVNDPLVNSLSIQVPQFFDTLHLNFSYHTEHHIFPSLNSDYYPLVQELLKTHYPERFNLLPVQTAWTLLLSTPRHYSGPNTFTTATGDRSTPCPCGHRPPIDYNGEIDHKSAEFVHDQSDSSPPTPARPL